MSDFIIYQNKPLTVVAKSGSTQNQFTVDTTGSFTIGGPLNIQSGATGSLQGTSSWAINAVNSATASSADNFYVRGQLTASSFLALTMSSYVLTGSNSFGSSLSNTQIFTGSVSVTGSLSLNGIPVLTSNQTSSLTASYAITASYVNNASTASFTVSSSLAQTASYVQYAQSASFAVTALTVATASWANNATNATTAATASLTINSQTASYVLPLTQSVIVTGSINLVGNLVFTNSSSYVGNLAGFGTTAASASVFLGEQAGYNASLSANSIFLGAFSGFYNQSSSFSTVLGYSAGVFLTSSTNSTMVGAFAGYTASYAVGSTFVGVYSGAGSSGSAYSTFIGPYAGYRLSGSSYSIAIGYNAGVNNLIGNNNVLIGTNVQLASGSMNSINIGGLIFGSGSYFSSNTPSSGSANGFVGINQPSPRYSLDVSGNLNVTNGITGSLYGTSSWAQNFFTSSVTSASYASNGYWSLIGSTLSPLNSATLGFGTTGSQATIHIRNISSSQDVFTFEIVEPYNYGQTYGLYNGASSGVADRFYKQISMQPTANAGGSGRPDVVGTMWGYNHAPGGGRYNVSEAGFGFRTETHYETGGQQRFEFHMPAFTGLDGLEHRLMSWYVPKIGTLGAGGPQIETDALSLLQWGTQSNAWMSVDDRAIMNITDVRNTGTYPLIQLNTATGYSGKLNLQGSAFYLQHVNVTPAISDPTYRVQTMDNFWVGQQPGYGGSPTNDQRGLYVGGYISVDNRNASYYGLSVNDDSTSPWVAVFTTGSGGIIKFGVNKNAIYLGGGSTATRPATAYNSMIRYNTDNNRFEVYQNSTWTNLVTNLDTASWSQNSLTASYVNTLSQSVYISGSISISGSSTLGGNTTFFGSLNNSVSVSDNSTSVAYGLRTLAQSAYSHTEGYLTTASANYAHAEGINTVASGSYSHAEGSSTISYGPFSHTEGSNTSAIGNFSHAEGSSTTAFAAASHAEGFSTVSSGSYSHAEGYSTVSSGSYSHAEGGFASSLGNYSHAEGYVTLALGAASHAEGYYSTASVSYSHAEGIYTNAAGLYSHAQGSGSVSLGVASFSTGLGTVASGSFQMAAGQYNTQNNPTSLLVVGGGTSANRADVFDVRVDANLSGSIKVPTNPNNPSNPLTGSMYFNPTTNFLYIYNGTAWKSCSLF